MTFILAVVFHQYETFKDSNSRKKEKNRQNLCRVSISEADLRFDLSFLAEYRPAAGNEFTFRSFGETPTESGLVCKSTPVTSA